MSSAFTVKIRIPVSNKKKVEDSISKASSPIEEIVENNNKQPERKIEEKHQGHGIFKIFSKMKTK